MGLFNHTYKDTKETIISNYILCGGFAVTPLVASYFLSDEKIGSRALGIASLIITVPLTVITTAIAAVGVIGNTIFAAVALPTAQKDPLPETALETATPLTSSTQMLLQNMPQYEPPTPTVAPVITRPISPPINTQAATPSYSHLDNDTSPRMEFAR